MRIADADPLQSVQSGFSSRPCLDTKNFSPLPAPLWDNVCADPFRRLPARVPLPIAMKYTITIAAAIFVFSINTFSQLTNDTIQHRIRSAHADKSISLTYDAVGKTSKLMAVSDNFSKDEASRSGVLAMNFAIGHIYAGDAITAEPENFLLTFWVLSKKPRFGVSHSMTVELSDEMLVIGSARYVAKPQQQMEYLNFEISRANLSKIARATDVRFMLGDEKFTFTRSQMKLLGDLLTITELPK